MSSANKRPPRPPKVTRPVRSLQSINTVAVPTSALSEEWKKEDAFVEKKFAFEDAQLSMKKVDDALANLRKSRTLTSLEQASIDVSVALISLVNFEECNNPFVCMQQAAMFAAMGSKRGNNDEPFKRFLPLKTICSPENALNVLCRADCLRAVHFLHEAQYLCTWVASVCQAHRDVTATELPWNSRWLVVGVLTYTVSAAIEDTADLLSLDYPNAGILSKWDEIATEEISRGKSDALILVGAGPNNNNTIAMNSSQGTDVEPPAEDNLFDESNYDDVSHDGAKAPLLSSRAGAPLVTNHNDITDYGASHGTNAPVHISQAEAPSVSNHKYITGEIFGGSYSGTGPLLQFPPVLNVEDVIEEYLHEGTNNHATEDEDVDNLFPEVEAAGI